MNRLLRVFVLSAQIVEIWGALLEFHEVALSGYARSRWWDGATGDPEACVQNL